MKRKILVADKDSSLKEAFRVIFSDDQYEILYASNGKEAEKIAVESRPEVYIVNVNLSKYNGIEVYKKLQKEKFLETARFFFLKDENDSTELLGFQAEGVIEKPINFFKIHERIHREGSREEEKEDEDVIELTSVIEETAEPTDSSPPFAMVLESVGANEQSRAKPDRPFGPETTVLAQEKEHSETVIDQQVVQAGPILIEETRMEYEMPGSDDASKTTPEKPVLGSSNLDGDLRTALGSVMEDAATRLVEAMVPAVSRYVEDYTRQVLFDIAEKVIREEIDKLLKESSNFPGKDI